MPTRLDWISPVIKLLSENMDSDIQLDAGAMEDLEHPDIDELEDMLINLETKEVTEFLEIPTTAIDNQIQPTPRSSAKTAISTLPLDFENWEDMKWKLQNIVLQRLYCRKKNFLTGSFWRC